MKSWTLFYLLLWTQLVALPTGMKVQVGTVSSKADSAHLQVNVSGKAIMHWEIFDIDSHETVSFVQSASMKEAILNRVVGGNSSQILGKINANCPIYLVNPKGMLIGSSAEVKTGGFFASTADFSNEEFLAGGILHLDNMSEVGIVNLGRISTEMGDVVLIARSVINEGVLEAPEGTVLMGASEVLLYPDTKRTIFIRPSSTDMGELQNQGTIQAKDVSLMTQSIREKAICHTGRINANTLYHSNGKVYLTAESGGVSVEGSIVCPSGEISVQGSSIDLLPTVLLDVSGPLGGEIFVGNMTTTDTLNIESGSSLLANGTEGDGGKIIALAHSKNNCHGTLEAKALGGVGDGGFIEVSSQEDVRITSHPDLRSLSGKDGLFLLDPGSITITHDAASINNPSTGTFSDNYCMTQLGLGSFTLSTATDSTNGNPEILTVNGTDSGGAVNITWNNSSTFTLTGGDSVVVHAGAWIQCTDSGSIILNGGSSSIPAPGIMNGIEIQGATVQTTLGGIILEGYPGAGGGVGVQIQGASGNKALVQAGTQDLVVNAVGVEILGGTGANEWAELSTLGGKITIDGAGPLTILGSDGTTSYSQIITGGSSPITGDTILIGQTTPLTGMTLAAGTAPDSWAILGADQGGDIKVQLTGDCSITGGNGNGFSSGTRNWKARIYADNVTIDCQGNLSVKGGTPANFGYYDAGIYANETLNLNTHSGDLLLTGGSSSNYFSKYVYLEADRIEWSGHNCILQGGRNSGDAYLWGYTFLSLDGTGDVRFLGDDESWVTIYHDLATIKALGDFEMRGQDEFSSVYIEGNDLNLTVGGNCLLQGGDYSSVDGSETYIWVDDLNLEVGGNLTLQGGTAYVGEAAIWADNVNGVVGGDVSLIGGDYTNPFYYQPETYAVIDGWNSVNLSCRNLTLQAGHGIEDHWPWCSAEITSGGDVKITASEDIKLIGGVGDYAYSAIYTYDGGNIEISGRDFSFTGGDPVTTYAYDVSAMIYTYRGGNIVCHGRDISFQGGSAAGAGVDGYAGISSGVLWGPCNVSVHGREIQIKGGPSGDGNNEAGIYSLNGGFVDVQGDLISLEPGSGTLSDVQISTANGGDLSISGGSLNMIGGAALPNQQCSIKTQESGSDIFFNLSGKATLLGGSLANTGPLIECAAGGNLDLQVGSFQIEGGPVPNVGDTGIRTPAGDISIFCSENFVASAPVDSTSRAVVQTFGSDLTLTTGGSIDLSGFTVISTPVTGGHLSLIAGQDISIRSSAQVTALSPLGSLTLVVDQNFPTRPKIGSGRFLLYPGATISAGTLSSRAPLKIYTARSSQNSIQELIHGAPFTPGLLFINSSREQWAVYFNGGVYGGYPFKVYYKDYGIIPSGLSMFYRGIAANLTALADLLPVLHRGRAPGKFPNYHFQLCNQTKWHKEEKECDPTLSPYGSFIFEDDVYWIFR